MDTDILAKQNGRRHLGRAGGCIFWGGANGGLGIGVWVGPLVKPFLKPHEKQSVSFPCPAQPACEGRHEAQETDFGLVAICMCGPGDCDSYRIEPRHVMVYGLDMRQVGSAIVQALGMSASDGSAYASAGLVEIGRYAPVAAPIYLSVARS